jgi:hypothetical protein
MSFKPTEVIWITDVIVYAFLLLFSSLLWRFFFRLFFLHMLYMELFSKLSTDLHFTSPTGINLPVAKWIVPRQPKSTVDEARLPQLHDAMLCEDTFRACTQRCCAWAPCSPPASYADIRAGTLIPSFVRAESASARTPSTWAERYCNWRDFWSLLSLFQLSAKWSPYEP